MTLEGTAGKNLLIIYFLKRFKQLNKGDKSRKMILVKKHYIYVHFKEQKGMEWQKAVTEEQTNIFMSYVHFNSD